MPRICFRMRSLGKDKPDQDGDLLKKIGIVAGVCGGPILILISCILLRRLFIFLRRWINARRLKLPTALYPPGGAATEADSAYSACVICVENFAAGEEVAVLPCTHLFHPSCIRKQVRKQDNARCAICKAPLVWSRYLTVCIEGLYYCGDCAWVIMASVICIVYIHISICVELWLPYSLALLRSMLGCYNILHN